MLILVVLRPMRRLVALLRLRLRTVLLRGMLMLRRLDRVMLRPPLPPAGLPARGGRPLPSSPGGRGHPIILDRYSQDWPRHELGRDDGPRTVVPRTDEPAVIRKYVVAISVEEIVRAHG